MRDNGGFPVGTGGGVPVVAAPEELDLTTAPHLELSLAEASAEGHGTFVVDMTRTRFCDSAGLNVLIAAHKRAQADGGGLMLAVGGKAVLRVLEITGVDTVIPCFASLEETLAHVSCDRSGGRGAGDAARASDGYTRQSSGSAAPAGRCSR